MPLRWGRQVLALIPFKPLGINDNGGLFVDETRETAHAFRFLLSIPAIAASGLLELKEATIVFPRELQFIAGRNHSFRVVGYASICFCCVTCAHTRREYLSFIV